MTPTPDWMLHRDDGTPCLEFIDLALIYANETFNSTYAAAVGQEIPQTPQDCVVPPPTQEPTATTRPSEEPTASAPGRGEPTSPAGDTGTGAPGAAGATTTSSGGHWRAPVPSCGWRPERSCSWSRVRSCCGHDAGRAEARGTGRGLGATWLIGERLGS